MGIYTDALANTKSFDSALPREGVHRAISREIQAELDRVDTALASAYAAANAVHVIATDAVDHTGGTFELTVNLYKDGVLYAATTAALDFDATAAEVETAIDTAVDTAAYPGYVAGDIAVTASGTDLQDGTITLTYSGDSVAGLGHGPVTMLDERTGGTSPAPAVAATAYGNATREAMAILLSTSTVIGEVPAAATNPTWVAGSRALGRVLSLDTIKALARDAAIADNNPTMYSTIGDLFGF